MRVGILGGSFDPPHAGHLRMARVALAQLGLDRVLFVPCSAQPLKGFPPWASPFHRSAMLALAVAGRPGFALDFRELDRGGLSYTAETLEALHAESPRDRLYLIMGSDSLESFVRWRRSGDILALSELAVMPRAGGGGPQPLLERKRVHRLQAKPLAVSSTAIRSLLAKHESIAGLVPKAVMLYIERQKLYAARRGRRERRTI